MTRSKAGPAAIRETTHGKSIFSLGLGCLKSLALFIDHEQYVDVSSVSFSWMIDVYYAGWRSWGSEVNETKRVDGHSEEEEM